MFESLGNLDERRARIAVRDGDYVSGLHRWTLIASRGGRQSSSSRSSAGRARSECVGLIKQLVEDREIAKVDKCVDGVLDRYHQSLTIESLLSLNWLAETLADAQVPIFILFRVHNFILLSANRLGLASNAKTAIAWLESHLLECPPWPGRCREVSQPSPPFSPPRRSRSRRGMQSARDCCCEPLRKMLPA